MIYRKAWALTVIVFVATQLFAEQTTFAQMEAKQTNAQASAQELTPDNLAYFQQKIESYRASIEERAKQVIDSEFLRGRSITLVKVEGDPEALSAAMKSDGALSLSMLPRNVSRSKLQRQYIENLTVNALKRFVKKVDIDVTVDKTVGESQRLLVEKILRGSLNIPDFAKISTQVSDLAPSGFGEQIAALEKDRDNREQDRQRLADELARMQRDRESIAAEKRSVEQSLQLEQQKVVDSSKEIQSLKDKIAEYQQELDVYKTPLGDLKKLIKGLELPMTLLPIAVLALVAIVVVTALINGNNQKRSAVLRESIEIMSQALVKLGNRAPRSGESPVLSSAKIDALESALTPANHSNSNQGEFLAEEAKNIRRDAEFAWGEIEKHRFVVLCELREWLVGDSGGKQSLMSLVSALNPKDAAAIIGAFPPNEVRDLKNVVIDVSDRFRGYSLILSLHRAVQAAISVLPSFVAQLDVPNLIHASDSDIAKTIQEYSTEQRGQILRLLPTNRWSRILEIHAEMVTQDELAAILISISHQSVASDEDGYSLITAFDRRVGELMKDESGIKTSILMDDMVAAMDSFGTKLKAAMTFAQKIDPRFSQEIRERAITIEHVMSIEPEILRELVDNLDPEQISNLLSSLDQIYQEKILTQMSPRLQSAVKVDMQRITSSIARKHRASVAGREVQNHLIAKVRELVEQGVITFEESHSGLDESDATRKVG